MKRTAIERHIASERRAAKRFRAGLSMDSRQRRRLRRNLGKWKAAFMKRFPNYDPSVGAGENA